MRCVVSTLLKHRLGLRLEGCTVRLVFLGTPGAGKGTQAAQLKQQLTVPHISTGDMLREMVKEDSPLAQELRSYIESGRLVPDDKMNEAVKQRLGRPDAAEGFILDGYPRTVVQAEALRENLSGKGQALDAVVFFNLPRDVAVERLSGRRTCRQCGQNWHVRFTPTRKEGVCDKCGGELYQRDDDKAEVIEKRFEVFQEKTAGLIDYYRNAGLLREIDATPGLDEIHSRLLEILNMTS